LYFSVVSWRAKDTPAREIMDGIARVRYWVARLRAPTIAMWLIGSALPITEVPRNQLLGDDLFGFGMEYFGP
jgi:hypothetical protein